MLSIYLYAPTYTLPCSDVSQTFLFIRMELQEHFHLETTRSSAAPKKELFPISDQVFNALSFYHKLVISTSKFFEQVRAALLRFAVWALPKVSSLL
jgi:hypothetical protein